MADEFETARERIEAYPTIEAYCRSRTREQLARLICNNAYRSNVFGSYNGTYMGHSMAVIDAAIRKGAEQLKSPPFPANIRSQIMSETEMLSIEASIKSLEDAMYALLEKRDEYQDKASTIQADIDNLRAEKSVLLNRKTTILREIISKAGAKS